MKRMTAAFILFLLAVLAGTLLGRDAGYVFIAAGGWTLETTLLIAIILLCLVFLLGCALFQSVRALLHVPGATRRWRARRRAKHAAAQTRKGFIAFSEGDWDKARHALTEAAESSETPLLNYLTAARAAQELGENPLRDDCLRKAGLSMPQATVAVELTQAQLQMANGQHEQALATLQHLQDVTPSHPYVQKLLMELYIAMGDWQALWRLGPALAKNRSVPATKLHDVMQQAASAEIQSLVAQKAWSALDTFIKKMPKTLAADDALQALYCEALLKRGETSKALRMLRKRLAVNLNGDLLRLLGAIPSPEALELGETLLVQHPTSPDLLICVGKLASANQLWGKARQYLEKSLTLRKSPEACAALGTLLERFGDLDAANRILREGLDSVIAKQAHPEQEHP